MTLENLFQYGAEELKEAEVLDADLDAMYLLLDSCNITKMDYLLDRTKEVSKEAEQLFRERIRMRADRIPLQHILGTQEFMGYEFWVNEHVLTPRQDTELLVEETAKYAKGKRVLDMCTGSGCILLSLCKLCDLSKAVGVDLSLEALKIAEKNRVALDCEAQFIQSDLFEKVDGTFDVIVSNPPYIVKDVIPTLMEEVREHEPHMALDGGVDGLDFYREIVDKAPEYLVDGGYLAFEIGYDQGKTVPSLMEEKGFSEIRVLQDLVGLDRVVIGLWSVEHG